MRNLRKRPLYLIGLGAVAAPLLAASVAYACTSLATLSLNPSHGPPGQTVTVTGRGFAQHDPSDARTGQPVEIRFDSTRNPVLARGAPSGPGGEFTVQIQVPNVAPGSHVVIATQNRADGRPAGGTPARQAFTVTAPQRAGTAAQPGAPIQSGAPGTASQPAGRAAAPAATRSPAGAAVGQSPTAAVAPAPEVAPAPGTAAAQAQAQAQAPGAAPVPFGAPAQAPVGRRSMTADASGPATGLVLLLVAAGLVLSLSGGALVLAGRARAGPALARRSGS